MTEADPDRGLLAALLDTIQPADEDPGAARTGLAERLTAVLTEERPEWWPRLRSVLAEVARRSPGFAELDLARRTEVLDGLADDAEQQWFTALVHDIRGRDTTF